MQNEIAHHDTWLIVGSSPSAPVFFDAAREVAGISMCTITTNGGWQLFLTSEPDPRFTPYRSDVVIPHYYWLSDHKACELFDRPRRFMQARGTKIICPKLGEEARRIRNLQHVDHMIELSERGSSARFERGRYVHPRLSGLICLQIAINNGAKRVVMVGMDGYTSTPDKLTRDTFDGRMGKAKGASHTHKWIAPFTQSVIDACPDVHFTIMGKLQYQLTGTPGSNNVTLYRRPEELLKRK